MQSDERFVLSPEEAKIVEENFALVKWLVWNKIGPDKIDKLRREENIQIGAIGLIKAVKTFDGSKGIKFATYASRCILNEIKMDYRKAERWSRNISLEHPISVDDNGCELKLKDTLVVNMDDDFEEDRENRKNIERALMLILNSFSTRSKCIMLFSIAGVPQCEIADLFGISQSYVSRILKRDERMLKFFNNRSTASYREVFKVDMNKTTIKISFSANVIENFEQCLEELLSKDTELWKSTDFKISRSKEQIMVYIPAERESFALLAMLIKEIEDCRIKYRTVKG